MTFIPDSFVPPRDDETPHLSLQVLSEDNAVQDYECVMACADDIRGVFGPDNGWPAKDMTLADNLSDLKRHEREFFAREAFAYSIFERSTARRYVGCVYIKPIKSRVANDRRKALFNAQACCWFSPVVTDREFAKLAADEIVQWVKTSWPFTKVAFPCQTIGWDEWYALACEPDR
jgi:hypothetical protein